MAVNLIATARLNTAPYERGLQRIAAGTAGLAATTVSTGKKTENVWTDNERAAKAYERGVRSTAAAHAAAGAAAQKSGTRVATSLNSQRYLYHDLSRQAASYAVGLAALPALAIGAGAVWEKQFANVIRTSDLKDNLEANRAQFDALRDSLVGMAQVMPASFGSITEVATLANQMGIAANETADFTRAAIMFSEASGVSVDVTATAFGRLKSLVADVGSDYMGLADSILKVGVNSVATEDEIINVTTQISSIAAQAGFTSKEMIGLSGALASVRVPPELSRGLITRVFGQIDRAVSAGGTGLDTLARISGRTSEQFKQQWGKEGAAGTLFRDFVKGLQEAGPAARAELESLGITSVRDVPVMLRLANAADSNGVIGGLLTQTMKDAQNGAGETQKQYEIMADTVIGKLKILGNNLLAFFDGVGQTGLGTFGDLLDNMSKGLRNLTRDLDKPAKMLGSIELPWTNAEALGFIGTLALITAGFIALGSVAAKVRAGVVALKSMGALLGGGKLASGLGGMFGGSMIGNIGKGTSKLGGFSTALGTTAGAAVGLRAGLGKVVGFLGGPWGVAAAAGITALSFVRAEMQKSATTADDLSLALARVNPKSQLQFDKALSEINLPYADDWGAMFRGEWDTNPFEGGLDDMRDTVAELMRIREKNISDAGGWEWGAGFGEWMDRTAKGLGDEIQGIKLFDESLQGLIDSGNTAQAAKLLQTFGRSGKELEDFFELTETANSKAFLKNMFDANDIAWTSQNLDKFTKGTLKELQDGLTGLSESDKIADSLFGGDLEAMGQFANIMDEVSASFIDFSGALEKGWQDADGNPLKDFSLGNYITELDKGVKAQGAWMDDMITIADHASVGLVQHLAELGPAAAPMLSQLADELSNGVTTSLDAMEESFASRTAGFGNALAEAMANQAWIKSAVGDTGLATLLTSQLTSDEMSSLYDAARGVGDETVRSVMQGIARNELSIEQAIHQLLLAQDPEATVNYKVDFDMDESAIAEVSAKAHRAIQEKFRSEEKIEADAEINVDTTVAQLRRMMDDPTLNKMEIDGELSLEEAYAENRAFQVWAQSQGIDILLGANAAPAKLTTAALVAYVTDQEAKLQIDALPELAEGHIWDIVELADGTTGYIELNGDNELAMEAVYAVDAETKEVREIPMDGNNIDALNKLLAVRNDAKNPAVVPINAEDNGARAFINSYTGPQGEAIITIRTVRTYESHGIPFKPSSQDLQSVMTRGFGVANGGAFEYYANGGVRENHVAQIAPAGAMRLWAEPETGGEAYIPLAKSKRARSEAILNDVAQRFGYALQPQNYTKFADGGQYMAQVMSRQRYTAPSVRGSDQGARLQVGPVTFTQNSQKDQFREFSRTLNRVARGL